MTNELRQAVRALGHRPGTTALSILTLAFGIAAATTTFSAVYAAVLRPVPFSEPARLLLLSHTRQNAKNGIVRFRWSFPGAGTVRQNARAFESIGTFSRASLAISPSTALSGTGEAEQVDGELVTSGYFEALRVAPAIGQGFTLADDTAGHPVALLADGLWRRRFGADPNVVGQTLQVNDVALSIAGGMPAGFDGVSGRAVLWLPAGMAPRLPHRDYLITPQPLINLVARPRPGVLLARAKQQLK